ncbi:peptidoglycan-binding protein [Kosmotoga pacifica]|uniref:Peptidoglycan-binding protein n=2 Tax=Kosmotoga pacifica TaxID=1330330 RepID=A0A0G2ZHV9_9BACT|nr:peptidoglycan-binding protein [Kosmotoga pacifica]
MIMAVSSFGYIIVTYVIKPGDTLYSIAKKHDLHVSTILDFNEIEDPRNLKIGDTILFPQPDGLLYEVKEGETLTYIAKLFFAPVEDIVKANNIKNSDVIIPGQKLFIPMDSINKYGYEPMERIFRWPVYGVISSNYGWRTHPITGKLAFHTGLDIAAPMGAPIFAAATGYVVFAGLKGGYGYMVEIQHDNGMITRYAHMSHISVYVGQRVFMGSLLGRVGATGLATGPHVHFEVRDNEYRTVDPLSTLPAKDLMYVIRGYQDGNTDAGGK